MPIIALASVLAIVILYIWITAHLITFILFLGVCLGGYYIAHNIGRGHYDKAAKTKGEIPMLDLRKAVGR